MSRLSSDLRTAITPLILSAHTEMQARGDASYPFTQEANFLWLTHINWANWWYIATETKEYLVMPEVNETQQLFDGSLSTDEAIKQSGIDEILTRKEGQALIKKLAEESKTVYTLGKDPHAHYYEFAENPALKRMRSMLAKQFETVEDARPQLARARAVKSSDEIEMMETAIQATIGGFETVKSKLATVTHEYEIEAVLNAAFRETGAQGHAYAPIVASGKNACTLHYVQNSDELPKNGLVLIDAGAQFDGYAADVTRTYAIGTPTPRQIEVHQAVEKAHQAIIKQIKPGLSFGDYQKMVDEVMKEALESLGVLKKPEDYRTYFPHAISHGLGIDVHESLGGNKAFQPGMTFTVEPGIYIPEEGIGVRIEDDLLITEDGIRNLTEALPTGL